MANTYTAFTNASDAAQRLLLVPSGINIVSAIFTGTPAAASFFDSISIGGTILGSGILLTSGVGIPPLSNTSSGFGQNNGQLGDTDLENAVHTAFPTAGETHDASVLEFKVNVTDPAIKSIKFDVAFASDEFSEFSSTDYVDIAAVFVNGVNVAYFNNNASRPLSVLDENLAYFQDNEGGSLNIEYDGISYKLVIAAPVHQGENTIKIAVADTQDFIYDSGIFVSNLRGSDSEVTGGLESIEGTIGDDSLVGIGKNNEFFVGGLGNDTIKGKKGDDIMNGGDGDDLLNGGKGFDILIGAGGNDTFDFNDFKETAKKLGLADVVTDFEPFFDQIDVKTILEKTKFKFIGEKNFSDKGKAELRYEQHDEEGTANDYTAILGDVNGNGKTDFAIRLNGLIDLTKADFVL